MTNFQQTTASVEWYYDSKSQVNFTSPADNYTRTIGGTLTANRVYALPDSSGTLALANNSIQVLAAYTQANGNPINLNSSAFQQITLTGGTKFWIQNVLITNANATPQSSTGAVLYDYDQTTEMFNIASSVLNVYLTKPYTFIDWLTQEIVAPTTFKTVGNTLYFQRGGDIGTKVADMYITGLILG